MYDSFYSLSKKPFGISTDPRFLWCGEKHNEALANLKYGVMERNGFVVLTGDIGTGKTTLVNALLELLSDDVLVAKVNHPSLEPDDFLTLVAKTFDASVVVDGKSDLLLFFNTFLKKAYQDGKVALLIVDEAHRLSIELLEEIRLLSNIEQDGMRLLNIIFVGQNELKPMLSSPQCRALQQRITLYYDIPLLSEKETVAYVGHRLGVSGLQERLFTEPAFHKIYAFSQGNPRLINILCDRAMLTGYLKARRIIDADIVRECAREIVPGHHSKRMVIGDTLRTIAVRHRMFMEALTSAPVVRSLRASPGKLVRAGKETVKDLRLMIGALKEHVAAAADRLAGKYRRRAIAIILAAGMASIFLALAVGAFKVAGSNDAQSIAAKRLIGAVGLASTHSQPPAALPVNPVEASPAASAETIGVPTSDQAASLEINASDPIPSPEDDTAPLINAHEQPGSVEMAAAALEKNDYQLALGLLEADQGSLQDKHSKVTGLYAKALVGRAGEIIAAAPLQAETMLLKAVEIAPDTVQAFLMLGKYYTKIKDYPRAADTYQKAVHLDPLVPDAFFNLGFIYATLGRYEAAEQAFSRVVRLEPPYLGKSLFNLAVVQQKLGKKTESLANLEQAVTLAPENEKALAYLSLLKGEGNKTVAEKTIR